MKIVALRTPARLIASRSFVMPSRVTCPFIQCHHVPTLDVGAGSAPAGSVAASISAAAAIVILAVFILVSAMPSRRSGPLTNARSAARGCGSVRAGSSDTTPS